MNGLKLIATGGGNWDYYLRTFSDGSKAVMFIAKENSGAADGIYCGAKNLRAHFSHMKNLLNRESLLPDDWYIVDEDFFRDLGII